MGYVRFIPIYSLIGSFRFEVFNRGSVVYMDTVFNTEFPPGPRQDMLDVSSPLIFQIRSG